MDFTYSLYIELIKSGLSLILLVITWLGGQKILSSWELEKKKKELDILTASQFQQLYGEYKTVWRLWKVLSKQVERKKFSAPDDTRWELLARITAAEGNLEAIVVKLVTEYKLEGVEDIVGKGTVDITKKSDIITIGLFRQAYQRLRQGIRNNLSLSYNYEAPEYVLFNELACSVANLIASDKKRKSRKYEESHQALTAISKVREQHWIDAIEEKRKLLPQPSPRRIAKKTTHKAK